jgi:methyl-accepting chemotaxis protein
MSDFLLSLLLMAFPAVAVGTLFGFGWGRRSRADAQRVLLQGLDKLSRGDLYPLPLPRKFSAKTRGVDVVNTVTAKVADQVTRIRSNAALLIVDAEAMAHLQEDVTARTESQAANIEQVAATVAGLSEASSKTAKSVGASVLAAKQVRQLADECKELSVGAQNAMRDVKERSEEMNEFLGRIDRIAKTTQVLSMNASVAAAKAGAEGRGFQAIATEIRSLANQSGEALFEIRALISRSNSSTQAGTQRIESVHLAIDRMALGLGQLTADFERHSHTTTEQSMSLREISEAVSELDRITQENAAMVDVQSALASAINSRAERLAELFIAWRAPAGAADEARILVLRAVAAIDRLGYQEGLRAITEGAIPCAERDMYVFAYDESARYIAFAGKPERVGQQLPDTPGRNRSEVVREGISLASRSAGGWMEYATPHPVTGEMLPKLSYVRLAAGRFVVGCGIYKVL